jgi:hypothetical protein
VVFEDAPQGVAEGVGLVSVALDDERDVRSVPKQVSHLRTLESALEHPVLRRATGAQRTQRAFSGAVARPAAEYPAMKSTSQACEASKAEADDVQNVEDSALWSGISG